MAQRGAQTAQRAGLLAVLGLLTLLAGCATTAPHGAGGDADAGGGQASRVAELARELKGTPYRFGGEGPNGFDCSGLVHYVYEQAGIDVPRTARGQYEAVHPLYPYQLRPGDLVFFRTQGVFVSHVGIYVGDGRFVHALKPGQPVKTAELDTNYWQERLVRAGSLTR